MATISMSSNKKNALYLGLLTYALVLGQSPSKAAEVCPIRSHHALKYGGPFDGTPEEKASLIPDKAGKRFGYWELAYVYDAGRFVTFRCEYADSKIIDVRLEQRVSRCEYTISREKTLRIVCK